MEWVITSGSARPSPAFICSFSPPPSSSIDTRTMCANGLFSEAIVRRTIGSIVWRVCFDKKTRNNILIYKLDASLKETPRSTQPCRENVDNMSIFPLPRSPSPDSFTIQNKTNARPPVNPPPPLHSQ